MTDREVVTIKEYIDEKFKDLEKRLTVQFELTDKALHKAEETNNARLEHMNEFRAQILEERGLYARQEDLARLEKSIAQMIGRAAGKEWIIGICIAVALATVALLR